MLEDVWLVESLESANNSGLRMHFILEKSIKSQIEVEKEIFAMNVV